MAKATLAARILLGLIFFVFGLNGFLNFIPTPEMPEHVQAFMGALMQTGYFFPVLKGTEVICGALLLAGFYVPLALTILAPIIIQIFLFHAVMAPDGLIMAILIVALEIFLAWRHKAAFQGVLKAK